MSHNVTALVPYITDFKSIFSLSGSQSFTIQGFGLGLGTRVEIPAALGYETGRSFTKTGATAGTLTITASIATLPNPAVVRTVNVSMGGVPAQGTNVTTGAFDVTHGWTVSLLNPMLWLDANDATTFSLSGSDIISWTDKSSGSHVMTQGTAADRPERVVKSWFQSGSATGHVFHSSEVAKQLDTPDLANVVDADLEFTHFVVMSVPGHNHYQTWYFLGNPTNPCWGHRAMGDSHGSAFMYKTHPGGSLQQQHTDIGTANDKGDNVPHLITFQAVSGSGYSTRLDGTVVNAFDGEAPLKDVNPAASSADGTGIIGVNPCDIAEIIHVARQCTNDEIETVEAYLNAKWGVY